MFYGHPGIFAWSPHEVIKVALAEHFQARMEPGISSEDCLYADLGVAPGRYGCQHYEARQQLSYGTPVNPGVYLVLWQVGLVGDRSMKRFCTGHDGLTGSFNREYLFDEAERTLRRLHKAGADACLVLLDLDHFKRVNDTCGHAVGDEVLRSAVFVCRRELRESNVSGRLGGAEFGILIPASSRDQGIVVATRICQTLAATPMAVDPSIIIMMSASFGLARSTFSGQALAALYGDAEAVLYLAKKGGRNRLVVDAGIDAPAMFQADFEVAVNT